MLAKLTPALEMVTHNNTVLHVCLQADSDDITDVSAAQRTKETRLAVLMASQQLLVCHHETTWDTRGWGDTLRNDLEAKWLYVIFTPCL